MTGGRKGQELVVRSCVSLSLPLGPDLLCDINMMITKTKQRRLVDRARRWKGRKTHGGKGPWPRAGASRRPRPLRGGLEARGEDEQVIRMRVIPKVILGSDQYSKPFTWRGRR